MKVVTRQIHEVVQDETYPHMYRVRYPDGVTSEDLYGEVWARDLVNKLNSPKREEVDA